MNKSLEEIPNHMLELGLSALAHANRHSCYAALENHKWQEMSVLQAAHASEILIKARIAQEHPLLIFEQFPKISGDIITINELFEKGKTIEWSDLPQRLWACAGLKIPEIEKFREFGKLRNGIQHFMSPSVNNNLGYKVMDYIFSVLDPFINNCWGLYAVDFDEDYNSYENLPLTLIRNEIPFLVSSESASYSEYWEEDLNSTSGNYRIIMQRRIAEALPETK